MQWRRWLAATLIALALMGTAPSSQGQAADWTTKGSSSLRASTREDPIGLIELTEAWRAEGLGESSTQPLVIGQTVYHLAGRYLWKLEVDSAGRLVRTQPLSRAGQSTPEPVSQAPQGVVLAPQSTPSYSGASGILYFGTGYGWLWAYHTKEGWFKPVVLELGCPIVGSPLVIHDQGRDLVVVSDRPNYPSEVGDSAGRPLCPRPHGKVWIVQGLDQEVGTPVRQSYDAPTSKADAGGFGGFITPSAVVAPPHGGNPSLIIGADGFDGGRAIRLGLDRATGYKAYPIWTVDGSVGFAGNFTSDGSNAYWLDTAGSLWAADVANGLESPGWPAYSVSLPALIGVDAAFTNTEPAVEVRQTPTGPETHLYVTLRNQTTTGGPPLRGGPTGSDGAAVALGPGGTLKWYRLFGPGDRLDRRMASLNTAPLALTSRGALFFGDVNGNLYSYALDAGRPSGGDPRVALARPGELSVTDRLFLLNPGEEPARGEHTFSQVSGVGVDPVFAHGLLLVGVNYVAGGTTSGRLVAYRAGTGYDLRWLDPQPEPLELTLDDPIRVSGRVQLELTDRPLAQLCTGTVPIQWYLTDRRGQLVRPLGEVPLPADLQPRAPHTVSLTARLTASDPDQGQILGIIDHPSVHALSQEHPLDPRLQLSRSIASTVGMPPQKSCAGAAAEVIQREGDPTPEGGLANNVLVIPYSKRVMVDDPFIAEFYVPTVLEAEEPFEIGLYLGYHNNLGRTSAQVQVRLWARPGPGSPVPAAGWQPLTIDQTPCCTQKTGSFDGLGEGTWELVAELQYPGDTDLANNHLVRQVEVRRWETTGGDGVEGGAITD